MKNRSLFIAATGQNVGKTTICLGLISALKKKCGAINFMKPVGQEHLEVEGLQVDKDVVLFKKHFHLKSNLSAMSPVLFPKGFTKDYIDGHIQNETLLDKIHSAYKSLPSKNFTIVEGTGHVGVGSIADLNNAKVASHLGLDVILIASGGLGSSFDELALNKCLLDHHRVKIRGVILNKVLPEKLEMVKSYMTRALKKWDIPLIGCVPFNQFLSTPAMEDFEELFKTKLMSGQKHHLRHFQKVRLVAASLEIYQKLIEENQLVITPASREDIILATLSKHLDTQIQEKKDLMSGMILTGSKPPSHFILDQIQNADIPMLYAPVSSYRAMKKITTYTAKTHVQDLAKVLKAIDLVESNLDLDYIL